MLFLMLMFVGNSQTVNLDKYKYAIVKSKFDFVRQVDGYQTSSLTKFLFNKMGFTTYLDNEEFDEEYSMNRCSAIYVEAKDDSGLLNTKIFLEIKDCRGKLLFTSANGSSRLKQYVKAYRQSIKEAFNSVKAIGYNYDSSLAKKEVKAVEVVEPLKVEKKKEVVVKKPVMVTKKVPVKATETSKKEVKKKTSIEVLYAQPKGNGFQLVNTKPEIIFVLLKTSDPNKFIIKDKNGTLVKKGDYWVAEFYDKDQLITKKYQIKF